MSCTNRARHGGRRMRHGTSFLQNRCIFSFFPRQRASFPVESLPPGTTQSHPAVTWEPLIFFSSSRRRPGSSAFADQGGTRGHWITRRIRGSPFVPSASPMFATASCLRSPAFAGMTNRGFDQRVPGDTGSRVGCVRPRVTRTSSLWSQLTHEPEAQCRSFSRDAKQIHAYDPAVKRNTPGRVVICRNTAARPFAERAT